MAELALDRDFLRRYGRLPHPIQAAVVAAIGKFSEHTQAGLHLEKLTGARDPNIRTIRINDNYRGIVLALGDARYLLHDVLPHVPAYRDAVNKVFTVNQAVGVLEVRDQQRIDEFASSLPATPPAVGLFDRVSNAELRDLGISPGLFPLLPQITSDDLLDSLCLLLPEAQRRVLTGLASGISPAEVMEELSSLILAGEDPGDVDIHDLTAAARRTPDRIAFVSGPIELAAILARPFDLWRTFLHPVQHAVAYRETYSGPALITGSAGTGKTVTGLHRAVFLAKRLPDDGSKVLLTTFTRALADALDKQLFRLTGDPAVRARIDVISIDRLAYDIVSRGRKIKIATDDEITPLWSTAAASAPAYHDRAGAVTRFSAAFLRREWEQVVLAQQLTSLEAYLSATRAGRGAALHGRQRDQVWETITQAAAQLAKQGLRTHTQLADEAAEIAGRAPARYRHLVVDEAQDLHPAQWRLLRALVAPGPDDMFLLADPYQRIYDNQVSLTRLGIHVRGRTRRLTVNYRTTREILDVAVRVLSGDPVVGLDDQTDTLRGYSAVTTGKAPEISTHAARDGELDALVERVGTWLEAGVEPHAIAVAARTSALVKTISRTLTEAHIDVADERRGIDGVRVDTMHRMKGLEFQCLAVVGLDAGVVPAPHAVTSAAEDPHGHQQDLQRERCLVGEGKTEAALAAVEILARRTDASGCYLALPTRATSDAMFGRMLSWLQRLPDARTDRRDRDVQLAHGKAALNPEYDRLRYTSLPSGIGVDEGGSAIGVHTWLAGRKRALLSGFVVGTIDQLLFAALRGKHLVLRHLGLAGKVVVIDEAHAYDVFMSRFLDRALEWLGSYGAPVVVLSATLPAQRRADLMQAYDRGRLGPPPKLTWRDRGKTRPDPYADLRTDLRYPLVTVSADQRGAVAVSCADSGRGTDVHVHRLTDDPAALADLLRERLADGGCALVVRNTVARVQQTAADLRAALGSEYPVSLAHSRFMAVDRATKDRWLRETFGPPGNGARPHRHIVVASQVAEQSLDIDFDLLVTDLAPVDLVLQRIGRLHRHPRPDRPARLREANCWITGADWTTEPPAPVSGSRRVYQTAMLLRSAAVLLPHLDGRLLRLPADIAPLIQAAYGDTPVGPPAWQSEMAVAQEQMVTEQAQKQMEADKFRLAEPGERGTSLINWLSGGVGDVDDHQARGHVRDTDGETLEVLLLVRTADGLVVPPWIDGGGTSVPTSTLPGRTLQRQIARCTLPLPRSMTDPRVYDDVIAALESRVDVQAWQHDSPWLAGELVLDIGADGGARVAAFDLHYDQHEGLLATRSD